MEPVVTTIGIRRALPADAQAVARVMTDPGVFPQLLQLPEPDAWRQRLAEGGGAQSPERTLLAERDGQVVGVAGLMSAPMVRRRHTMFLGMAVLPAWQRQGVGRALLGVVCDYADNWAQVLRLELAVYVDNAAAIALYRAQGFEVEGTHRGYALRDGTYIDAHTMARWHPRPPALAS